MHAARTAVSTAARGTGSGPKERIVERLAAWKASPVPTMLVGTGQPEALRILAEACL